MKRVVLTGGSKGLGLAIKERLGDVVWDDDLWPITTATDFSRSSGCDLTLNSGLKMVITHIKRDNPDILILNAGTWKNNWRLNYESPKELAEQMPKDKLVIFILSNAAYRSYGNDDYTAAKGGLLHYIRRKQGEGFNFASISPGTIDTGFWDGAETDNRIRGAMRPEAVAELVYRIIKAYENGALVRELVVTPQLVELVRRGRKRC